MAAPGVAVGDLPVLTRTGSLSLRQRLGGQVWRPVTWYQGSFRKYIWRTSCATQTWISFQMKILILSLVRLHDQHYFGCIKRIHFISWAYFSGPNGSGKSSILQGLVLGLLADSRHTKRYTKLQDFVKRYARISSPVRRTGSGKAQMGAQGGVGWTGI